MLESLISNKELREMMLVTARIAKKKKKNKCNEDILYASSSHITPSSANSCVAIIFLLEHTFQHSASNNKLLLPVVLF